MFLIYTDWWCRSGWFFQYFKYFMPHSPCLHCFWLLFCSNYYFCPSLWLKISHVDFFSSFNIKWLNIVFLISILLLYPYLHGLVICCFSLILESYWFSFSIPMMYILHILVIVPLFLNVFCLFKILGGKQK